MASASTTIILDIYYVNYRMEEPRLIESLRKEFNAETKRSPILYNKKNIDDLVDAYAQYSLILAEVKNNSAILIPMQLINEYNTKWAKQFDISMNQINNDTKNIYKLTLTRNRLNKQPKLICTDIIENIPKNTTQQQNQNPNQQQMLYSPAIVQTPISHPVRESISNNQLTPRKNKTPRRYKV